MRARRGAGRGRPRRAECPATGRHLGVLSASRYWVELRPPWTRRSSVCVCECVCTCTCVCMCVCVQVPGVAARRGPRGLAARAGGAARREHLGNLISYLRTTLSAPDAVLTSVHRYGAPLGGTGASRPAATPILLWSNSPISLRRSAQMHVFSVSMYPSVSPDHGGPNCHGQVVRRARDSQRSVTTPVFVSVRPASLRQTGHVS